MEFIKLLNEILFLLREYRTKQKQSELAEALRDARQNKDTARLERIFNPNQLSVDTQAEDGEGSNDQNLHDRRK